MSGLVEQQEVSFFCGLVAVVLRKIFVHTVIPSNLAKKQLSRHTSEPEKYKLS